MTSKNKKTDWVKRGGAILRQGSAWVVNEWRKVTVAAVITLIAIVAIAGLGIYGLGWQNWFSGAVSSVVPFPAAYVGDKAISYHSYYRRVSLLKAEAVHGQTQISGRELGDEALGQLVSESQITAYAAAHGIVVTDTDVNQNMQKVFGAEGGEKAAVAALRADYGISESDYRDLLRSRLLVAKVNQSLQSSGQARQAAQGKAQGILNQAKSGTDFDKLASRYSEDLSGTQSGSAALRPVSSLPQAAQVQAVKLTDGQLYDGVINAGSSLYLIKRVSTVNGVPMVRQIVVNVDGLDQWLGQETGKEKLVKLLPQLR